MLDPDSDNDGVSDGRELSWGTNPTDGDSDGDGVGDAEAIVNGRDPLNPFVDTISDPELNISDGCFKGSRVVQTTTTPDLCNGHATLELMFRPRTSFPKTDNLVFVQIFRRTARKADGFRIPILPSLYIEYAGSPELDLHTLDGATVDHKVGELDPYYNGRDPQDFFSGAPDRQRAGFIRSDAAESTRMIYHCRTYEEHWRALNPEGVKEIQFDYETAAFCENGEGKGQFLGNVHWSWGKRRGGPVRAWMESPNEIGEEPTGRVDVTYDGVRQSVAVYRDIDPGQPSAFFSSVLTLWLKNHKFPWPGRDLRLSDDMEIVIPQPVRSDTLIEVSEIVDLPRAADLDQQDLKLLGVNRELSGRSLQGLPLPPAYFPFALPLQVTIDYSSVAANIADKRTVGVVRFDPMRRRYTAKDLYILRKDPNSGTITFCTSQFGQFALVHR